MKLLWVLEYLLCVLVTLIGQMFVGDMCGREPYVGFLCKCIYPSMVFLSLFSTKNFYTRLYEKVSHRSVTCGVCTSRHNKRRVGGCLDDKSRAADGRDRTIRLNYIIFVMEKLFAHFHNRVFGVCSFFQYRIPMTDFHGTYCLICSKK